MTVPVKVRSALTLLAVLVALTAMMFVFQAKPAQASEEVVSEARSWMGTAYRYPGMSYGVDCTEFTAAVFSQFGIYLPDYPSAQIGYGTPSDAGAGDLVFYSEDGFNITHAGIATGNGTVIHSSIYFGSVVETDMYGIPGYVGSRDVY